MRPFLFEHYGNPSSLHWAGMPAKDAVEKARGQVAGLLGCDPTEVVFTSGGSESNNHAIKGVFFANRDRGDHIITTAVEHPATLNPCRFLEKLGARLTVLPVDRYGMVDPDDVRKALTPKTILITVMHANNEVGTIEPIPEIAAIAREAGISFHTDAAQTVGKISGRRRGTGRGPPLGGRAQGVRAEGDRRALHAGRDEDRAVRPRRGARGGTAGGDGKCPLGRRPGRGVRRGAEMGRDAAGSGLARPVLGRAPRDFRGKGDAQRSTRRRDCRTRSTSTLWAGSARRSSRCFPGSPHRPARPATPARSPCLPSWRRWASRRKREWGRSGSAWAGRRLGRSWRRCFNCFAAKKDGRTCVIFELQVG